MNQSIVVQIQECEEQLKEAMLQSDTSTLNKLLSIDLKFTNHLGHLMTKQDDLDAHKSKILKINEITLTDQQIKIDGGLAIVTVNKTWQITAGHSSVVT